MCSRRRPRFPEHVVFRSFAQETVVLNLDTGTYHGLDPVGGRLLEILPLVGDVREAVAKIAEEYSTPVAVVRGRRRRVLPRTFRRGA